MTALSVEAAQRQLNEAQNALRRAEAYEAFEASFPEEKKLYLVIAKQPDFDQFVSYGNAGIPAAVFNVEWEAEYYAEHADAPAGYQFVVEEISLRGRDY